MVLLVTVTEPNVKMPPPSELSAAVEFPETVLFVTVTEITAKMPPPIGVVRCRGVSGDGAVRDRYRIEGANAAAAGLGASREIAGDRAVDDCHRTIGVNAAAVGNAARGRVSGDGAVLDGQLASGSRANGTAPLAIDVGFAAGEREAVEGHGAGA